MQTDYSEANSLQPQKLSTWASYEMPVTPFRIRRIRPGPADRIPGVPSVALVSARCRDALSPNAYTGARRRELAQEMHIP